jgi:hypothetical protein
MVQGVNVLVPIICIFFQIKITHTHILTGSSLLLEVSESAAKD